MSCQEWNADFSWGTTNKILAGMEFQETYHQYEKIVGEIHACNCIKFAAYRTASKLLVLQKSLGFTRVSLRVIRGVFEQHHIRSTDNNLSLSIEEIENVLHDIFYASSREDGNINVDSSVQITNLLLRKMFFRSGESSINVLNLKVILVSLCSSSLFNKYQYWFSQLMDHNLCLSKRRFHSLLSSLLLITDYLSEQSTFSHRLIEPTLESCFTEDHHLSLGISESYFLTWLSKEPQILVWLSTFYRLSMSQNVTHDVQCSVCGVFPMVGLRYHCLRCIRYDLCQLCFFTARTSKRHKSRHVIREYCAQTTFCETTSTFVKEIFKRLWGHPEKLQYLPVNSTSTYKSEDICDSKLSEKETKSVVAKESHSEGDYKVRSELRRIILEIEKESCRLLADDCDTSTKYLINQEAHFLQDCLNKIKALQDEVNNKATDANGDQKSEENNSRLENTIKVSNIDSCHSTDETSFCIPSPSGFSAWIEETQHETTYSKQLQVDLENIMTKLNNMLESNFSINDENSSISNLN